MQTRHGAHEGRPGLALLLPLLAAASGCDGCSSGGGSQIIRPLPRPVPAQFTRDGAGILLARQSSRALVQDLLKDLFEAVGRTPAGWQQIWAWTQELARAIDRPECAGMLAAQATQPQRDLLYLPPETLWLLTTEIVDVGLRDRPEEFGRSLAPRLARLGASVEDRSLVTAIFRQSSVPPDAVNRILAGKSTDAVGELLGLLAKATGDGAQALEAYSKTRDRAAFVAAYSSFHGVLAVANEVERRASMSGNAAPSFLTGALGLAAGAASWLFDGGWKTVWDAGKQIIDFGKNAIGALKGFFSEGPLSFLTAGWDDTEDMIGNLTQIVEAHHRELRALMQHQIQQLSYLQKTVDRLFAAVQRGFADVKRIMAENQRRTEERLADIVARLEALEVEYDQLVNESLRELMEDVRAILIDQVKGRVDERVAKIGESLNGYLKDADAGRAERALNDAVAQLVEGARSLLAFRYPLNPSEQELGRYMGSLLTLIDSLLVRGAFAGSLALAGSTLGTPGDREAANPLAVALLGLEILARARQRDDVMVDLESRKQLTHELRELAAGLEPSFLASSRFILDAAIPRARARLPFAATEWSAIVLALPFGIKVPAEHEATLLAWVDGPDFDRVRKAGRIPLLAKDGGIRQGTGAISYYINSTDPVSAAARDMLRAAVANGLLRVVPDGTGGKKNTDPRFLLVWDIPMDGFRDYQGTLATATIETSPKGLGVHLQASGHTALSLYSLVAKVVVAYEAALQKLALERLDASPVAHSQTLLSMLSTTRMVLEHLALVVLDEPLQAQIRAVLATGVFSRESIRSVAADPTKNGSWPGYVRAVIKTQVETALAGGSAAAYFDEVWGVPQEPLLANIEQAVRSIAAQLPAAHTPLGVLVDQIDAYCQGTTRGARLAGDHAR